VRCCAAPTRVRCYDSSHSENVPERNDSVRATPGLGLEAKLRVRVSHAYLVRPLYFGLSLLTPFPSTQDHCSSSDCRR